MSCDKVPQGRREVLEFRLSATKANPGSRTLPLMTRGFNMDVKQDHKIPRNFENLDFVALELLRYSLEQCQDVEWNLTTSFIIYVYMCVCVEVINSLIWFKVTAALKEFAEGLNREDMRFFKAHCCGRCIFSRGRGNSWQAVGSQSKSKRLTRAELSRENGWNYKGAIKLVAEISRCAFSSLATLY